MFTHAITRLPGPNFAQGITTADLGVPDYDRLLQQHATYIDLLRSLNLAVTVLDSLPAYPDAYFVEDVAVVTPEIAVITHPGAASRQGEEAAIKEPLAEFKPTRCIQSPGTVDGGDVLMVGKQFFIGISERTNQASAEQLGNILAGYGYEYTAVAVAAGLHLKSSVNYVGKNTLLITAEFTDQPAFARYAKIILDADEVYAANTLLVNEHLIMPQGFPKTRAKLAKLGLPISEIDVSEVQKMDGGLTCMSLRF